MDICTPVFYVRIKLFFLIFLFISSFATVSAYLCYPLAYISTVTSSILHSPPNIVLTTPFLFSTFLYFSLPYSLSLSLSSPPSLTFFSSFPFFLPFPYFHLQSFSSLSPLLYYTQSLPLNAEPEVFGMHDNANITCAITEIDDTFNTILALQVRALTIEFPIVVLAIIDFKREVLLSFTFICSSTDMLHSSCFINSRFLLY